MRGMSPSEIAEKRRCSTRQVYRVLLDAAKAVRAKATDRLAEVYHMMDLRLERLYSIVEMELQSYEAYMVLVRKAAEAGAAHGQQVIPLEFPDKALRAAVAIFERQAKLHGTDRGALGNKGNNSWLDDAPIEEVADYARSLGMTVPTEFKT